MKTAVIYVRVRVKDNAQEAIDYQMAACMQFAKEKGFEIVGRYIDNEEFKKRTKRELLNQLTKDCRKATWDAVIIYSGDRISRSLQKFRKFEDTLEKYGKSLEIVTASALDIELAKMLREMSKLKGSKE